MNERDKMLFSSPNDELAWIAYADALEEDDMRTDADFMRNVLQRKGYPIKASNNPDEVIRSMLMSGFRPLWPNVDLVKSTPVSGFKPVWPSGDSDKDRLSPLSMTPASIATRVRMLLIPPGRFCLRRESVNNYIRNPCGETLQARMNSFWLSETCLTQLQLRKLLHRQRDQLERITRERNDFTSFRPFISPRPRNATYPGRPASCQFSDWEEIHDYIANNGHWARTGLSAVDFYIPDEVCWEYACRAGGNTDFSIGNLDLEEARDLIGSRERREDTTFTVSRSVGEKVPNAFGLYDMQAYQPEFCRRADAVYGLFLKGGDVIDNLERCLPESRYIPRINEYAPARLMATWRSQGLPWAIDPPE